MAMVAPARGAHVDLYIPFAGRIVAEAQQSIPKIGARFMVPEARMENLNRTAVGGLEIFAKNTLMEPDCLQEPLGRGRQFVAELGEPVAAPLRVEVDLR